MASRSFDDDKHPTSEPTEDEPSKKYLYLHIILISNYN